MRLGIFGGSFDPVHYGHLLLAECCREQLGLERVWFLPTGIAPHKQDQQATPGRHRAAMLELAIAGHEAFAVHRYEVQREGVSYTVDSLEHFHAEDPSRELFLLVGADMLHDLPHWRAADRVCELAMVAAVHRPGNGEPDFDCLAPVASPERIALFRRHQVEMPAMGLSATDLRERVSAGRSIRYRTPRAVEKYIGTHRLYTATKE